MVKLESVSPKTKSPRLTTTDTTDTQGLPRPSPALAEINRQTEILALAFEPGVPKLHVDAVGILFRLQSETPTYRISDEGRLLSFVKSISWDPQWTRICLSSLEGRDVGDLKETLASFTESPRSFWSVREKLSWRLDNAKLREALYAIPDPSHQRAIVSAIVSEMDRGDELEERDRDLELRNLRQRNLYLLHTTHLSRCSTRFDPLRRR